MIVSRHFLKEKSHIEDRKSCLWIQILVET